MLAFVHTLPNGTKYIVDKNATQNKIYNNGIKYIGFLNQNEILCNQSEIYICKLSLWRLVIDTKDNFHRPMKE